MKANGRAKIAIRVLLQTFLAFLLSGCISENPYTSPGSWTMPSKLPDGTCPDISGRYSNVGQYPNISQKAGPIKWSDPLLSCRILGKKDYCGYKAPKIDQIQIDNVSDGIKVTAFGNGEVIESVNILPPTESVTCKDGWAIITRHGLWGNPMAFWFVTAKTSFAKSQGQLLVKSKSRGVEIPIVLPIISERFWAKFAPVEVGPNNSLEGRPP